VLKGFELLFGEPAHPEKLTTYTDTQAATFQLPDAYVGSSTKLIDTVVNIVVKSQENWQTSEVLPLVQIDGVEVSWDQHDYSVRVMNRVPAEGVSRMTTSLRRTNRERIIRRGLGMIIESDFMKSESGRTHFAQQLRQIAMSVQETLNYDVMYAILTAPQYYFQQDLRRGLMSRQSVMNAMRHEIDLFGIVQLERFGADRALEQTRSMMARSQVTPDTIIVPPELLLYLNVAPMEKIVHSSYGNKGITDFEAGVPGLEAAQFRGCSVYTCRPFDSVDDASSLQMLRRTKMVGEFYIAKKDQAIFLYDLETDSMKEISWTKAKTEANGGDTTEAVIIVRPFIEFDTYSAAVVKRGRALGATCYGHVDMQISANTSVKTIEGHYTMHSKAVVTAPQNVNVMRDIAIAGYIGGMGTEFFTGKDDVDSRLRYDMGGKDTFPSLMAIACTGAEADKVNQRGYMSLTGRVLPHELNGDVGSSFPGGEPNYSVSNTKYGLDQIHAGEPGADVAQHAFLLNGTVNNSVCFRGGHKVKSGTDVTTVTGLGHLGPMLKPGDARVLTGGLVSLETARAALESATK
jgi:hypothetical protein